MDKVIDKKSKFKKFLTTASALAVIAGASNAMGAATRQTTGNPATVGGANTNLNNAFVNGDNVQVNGAHNLQTGAAVTFGAGGGGVFGIDVGVNTGQTFTVNHAVIWGGGQDLVDIALNVAAGGSITIQDATTKAVTVNGGTLTMRDTGGAGGAGDLIVTNGTANVRNVANDVNISNGGVVNSTGTVGNDLIIANAGLFNGAAGSNVANDVTIDTTNVGENIVGTIGGALTLTRGKLTTNSVTGVTAFGANNARLTAVNNATFTGAITTLGNAATGGDLIFNGVGRTKAGVGAGGNALNSITINNGAVRMDAAVVATNLIIAHANGVADLRHDFNGATVFTSNGQVTLDAGKTITGAVTSTVGGATGVNGGKLVAKAAGEVTGAIGTAANRLDTVEVTGAGALHLSAGGNTHHYARQFLLKDNAAIIKVAATGILHGDAVANGNGNGVIRFLGAGEFDGKIGDAGGNGLAMFEANGAGIVKVGAGAHKAVVFTLTNGASEFEFANGAELTANINNASGAANNTKVKFTGSGKVSGTTGTANALSELNLTGDANSVVGFGGTITATNTNIGAGTLDLNNAGNIASITNFVDPANGGTLLITGGAAHTIGKIVTVGSRGTVSIGNGVGANTVTFAGQIGDRAGVNALKLFTLDSGNIAKFTVADSHITAINVGVNGGTLEFANAGATYKVGGITAINNKGTLKITENTTFESAANNAAVTFGTNEAKLAGILFENGKTLTVGDGISIYATKISATNVNNGTVTFLGDSTFAAAANGNIISAINVNGANKTVKLLEITNVNGNVTVANTGTLEIANNFTSALLQGAGASNGTVKFTNAAAMTVTGAVGQGGNSLKAIEFAGGNVDFAGQVAHTAGNEFTFSGKNASTVTFANAATDVGGNNFVNNSDNGLVHTVVLKNALTNFNVVKLAENGKQINFQLDNGNDVTINGATVATGANFTTGTNTKGQLTLSSTNDATVNSVGAVGKSLAKVQFTTNNGIANGLFAEQVVVDAGKTARLGGKVVSGDFSLAGDASKVVLSNGTIMDSAIKSTLNTTKGLVEFAGGGTLLKDIGTGTNKVESVTFADDANFTATLNTDNIFAGAIVLRKSGIKLDKNITLTGPTTTSNTPFILGDKKLTVANGNTLTFNGDNRIEFETVVNGDTVTGGQIESKGTLEFNAGTTLVVKPNDAKGSRPTGGKTRQFTLIANNSGTNVVGAKSLDITKVAMDDWANVFTKWTPAIDATGGLALVQQDNAEQVLLDLLGSSLDAADKANIKVLAAATQGTDGAKIMDLISSLTVGGNLVKAKVDETLDRLPPVTTITDAVEHTAGAVSMGLSQRMTNLAGSQGTPVQNRTVASVGGATSGISAGDDHARFGAWVSPFFGKTTQKERKGNAGYKSDTYGSSFGFDTRANDDMIIGGALTVANNEMKHKNFKAGDKTKISSLMFSLYGMQQITDNWFAHGVATFGSNEIKNTEKRVSGLITYDAVSGKYTSMSFNGEAMFGYNFLTEQVTFTPMAGLRYSRLNDGGYKEAGSTTGQNLDVNTKASNKLEIVAGARIAGGTFDVNGMTVTPEIHGFVNHDLIGKNPKQTLGLAGTTGLTAKSNKPVKTTFNLGLGVNAEYGMMEYGAGYDAEIATKRLGHQGTLKLRVNF